MDTKALRQKILDLAIRGKLVPQDPNDEPASVLLKRIRAEKEQMVKDGKLKAKDIKNDTVIFKGDDNLHYEQFSDGTVKCIEDEIPFELPEGWSWCRGYSCFKGMESLKPNGEYFDYIDIDSIDNKLHKVKEAKHILVKEAPSRASRKIENGSVLFSLVRPYLENIAYIDEELSNCIASTGFYICNSNGILDSHYMFRMMTSNYVINGLNEFMKGDNSPSIRKEDIENFLFPIPPIQEQICIDREVEVYLKTVNIISDNENKLTASIKSVKSKILDLAIRGKLVPQDPNDEPASVLLERIRAEKEEMIKQGKIKRDKKESVIFKGDDNSYYHHIENGAEVYDKLIVLPSGWVPCTISDISFIVGSKENQIKTNEISKKGKFPVISQSQEYIDGYCDYVEKVITLMPIVLFGDHTRVVKFIDFPFVVGADGTKLHKIINVNEKYVYYWMKYASTQIDCKGYSRHYSSLKKSCLLLPPLAEQKRIVDAIETLFAQIDKIAEQIS